MGWDEIKAWMNNAARAAAGVVSPPAHSPGAVGVAGIRSMLPGSRSFSQELDAYNRDAAPSPLYSPTSRFGSVVTDPAKPLEPSGGERERQMQMVMQMPMMGPTAYHGSPHVFDKFSSAKIGTGEGAQAYGHGLYFTSEPKVAEQYRKSLAPPDPTIRIGGVAMPEFYDQLRGRGLKMDILSPEAELLYEIATEARRSGAPASDVAAKMRASIANIPEWADDALRAKEAAKLRLLDEIDRAGLTIDPPGSFHQVDIPDNLLDFEKPLREQAPDIKANLNRAIEGRYKVGTRDIGVDGMLDVTLNGSSIGLFPVDKVPEVIANVSDYVPWNGATFYQAIGDRTPEKATEALRAAGIPGHSYKGETSGVKNFVVYDDAVIQPKGRWSSLQEFLRSQEKAP